MAKRDPFARRSGNRKKSEEAEGFSRFYAEMHGKHPDGQSRSQTVTEKFRDNYDRIVWRHPAPK